MARSRTGHEKGLLQNVTGFVSKFFCPVSRAHKRPTHEHARPGDNTSSEATERRPPVAQQQPRRCKEVLADTRPEASASQKQAQAGSAAEQGESSITPGVGEAGHSPAPASGATGGGSPNQPAAGQLLPDKSQDAAESESMKGRVVRYAATFKGGGCGTAGPGNTYLHTKSTFTFPATPAYHGLETYSLSRFSRTDAPADWGAGPPGQTGQEAFPAFQALQEQLITLVDGGQWGPEAMPWQWLLLDMLAAMPADSCGRQCLQKDERVLAAVLLQLTAGDHLTWTGLGVLAELLQSWAADDSQGMAALLESSPAAHARLQQLCILQAQQQQQSSLSWAPSAAAAIMEACLAAAGSQPAELVKAFHAVATWLQLLPGPKQFEAAKQLLERHIGCTVKLLKLELEGTEAQHLQKRVAQTVLEMLGDTAAMPDRAASSALASLGSWDLWRQISVTSPHSAPVNLANLLRDALQPALHIFLAHPGLCKGLTALLRQGLLQLQAILTQGKTIVLSCPSHQRHEALRLMVFIAGLLMTAHNAGLWRAARNKVLPAELRELQQAALAWKVPAAALEQLRGVLVGAGGSREPGAKGTRRMAGEQPDRSPVAPPKALYTMVASEPASVPAGAAVEAPAIVAQPGKQASKDAEVLAGAVAGAAGADLQPPATLSLEDPAEPMEMDQQLPPNAASHDRPFPRRSYRDAAISQQYYPPQ